MHGHGADLLKWSLVEKKQGEFNWNYYLIKPFIDNGYGILANVGLSPLWASSNPTATPYPYKSTYFGPFAYMPSDLNLWGNFLEKAYDQYKAGIDYWEIWNEPDIQFLVSDNKEKDYSKLLSSAISLKEKYSPNYKIAAPAIAYFIEADNSRNSRFFPLNEVKKDRNHNFLDDFLKDNLINKVEVFTFHFYKHINRDQFNYSETEFDNYKEKVQRLKAVIGNKPIFVTEFNVLSNNKDYDAGIDNMLSNILVFEHLQLIFRGC